MKRLKKQKLSFRSETVASLDHESLGQVVGGGTSINTMCAGPILCSKIQSGCKSGGTSDCNVSQICGGIVTVTCFGC